MTTRLLAGNAVLVTGANRGIGLATVQTLAANGAHVWATSRTPTTVWASRLQEIGTSAQTTVTPIQLDVTNTESVKAALSGIKASGTPLTGLVNNAGLTYNALLQMTRLDDARETVETNVFGVLRLMQGAIRLMMRQRSGSIVNISSSAAIDANPGRSVYGASKAAVSTLTKAAAREWGAYGVRVNAIAPGVTNTDMLESMTPEVLAGVEATTDLGRRAEPAEIAEAVCFLLSPNASYVSGQVLRVDGGMRT